MSINFGNNDNNTTAAEQRPSLTSWTRLSLHYRRQLVTAHVPHCIFRCEAQCWFSTDEEDDSKSDKSNNVVPSFLLTVLPEMIIFENQSSDKVQTQLIYQTILQKSSELDNFLAKFNTTKANSSESVKPYSFHLIEPQQLQTFITTSWNQQNNALLEKDHNFTIENQKIVAAAQYLQSLLNEWCSQNNLTTSSEEGEEENNDTSSNDIISRHYRTHQSVLLATMGWSLVPSSSDGNKIASHERQNVIVVECPCCLSRALVPIIINHDNDKSSSQDDSSLNDPTIDSTATKRVRVVETTTTTTRNTNSAATTGRIFWRTAPASSSTKAVIQVSNPPMHPLNSHRHFCPYLGGSLLHKQIGWEIVVRRMLQWKKEQLLSKN